MVNTKKIIDLLFPSDSSIRLTVILGVVLVFTLILYPGLTITRHSYEIGDVVEKDIKASMDFFIEDQEATESNRRQAVDQVLTVYDYDFTRQATVIKQVRAAFSLLQGVSENLFARPERPGVVEGNDVVEASAAALHTQILLKKNDFEETIGISVSKGEYAILEKDGFSENTENLISRILSEIFENGVVTNKEILLREEDKGIVLRNISTKTEQLEGNLKHFYGHDQAKAMVRIIGQPLLKELNYNLRSLIVDFSQRLLQPNITLNRSETEDRKKQVARDVKPVLYKIKAGEMLSREGERVTKVHLLKLDASQPETEEGRFISDSIGAGLIIFCLLLAVDILYLRRQDFFVRNYIKNLLFVASVLTVFFFLARLSLMLSTTLAMNAPLSLLGPSMFYGIPLASGAMLICLFMGLDLALPLGLVMAIGVTVILKNRFDLFIYFLLNGFMAAYWMRDCRERKVFIKAGVKLGILNIFLVTVIDFYTADFSGIKILWDWSFGFMGGIGAGIVTAGMAPLIEIAFDYTTDIKLLELANLDRPILKRLLMEAPGTYHHSVVVGSMVEAAASEINANSLLGKVCGYYHDIGKIKKPIYFIENQTNVRNPHDKLAPSMSKRILAAHVKDGVAMANENRLGQDIVDTIRQSHGTSLMSYFYQRALQQKGEGSVEDSDFRYPGPKPQTREAGLVMLADVSEAASRTLDNPTPSRIQGLVQKLINGIFSDGQLDECELTLKDLHRIAKSFNQILNGIHHHRIEYPEKTTNGNGKNQNGRSDRKSADHPQNIDKSAPKQGTGHLKRLGLS
jgi:cyclic-di-AMP phosphodiesterase PgpH